MKRILTMIAAALLIAATATAQSPQRRGPIYPQSHRSQTAVEQSEKPAAAQKSAKPQSTGISSTYKPANVSSAQQPKASKSKTESTKASKPAKTQQASAKASQTKTSAPAKVKAEKPAREVVDKSAQGKVDAAQKAVYFAPGSRNEKAEFSGQPQVPTRRKWDAAQREEMAGVTKIVVYTDIPSVMEASGRVADIMHRRKYQVYEYGGGNSWFKTKLVRIPTNLESQSLFEMKCAFARSGKGVKVTLTAQWKESSKSGSLTPLAFQPDSNYDTYLAWNVLEDIAEAIPQSGKEYQR